VKKTKRATIKLAIGNKNDALPKCKTETRPVNKTCEQPINKICQQPVKKSKIVRL